MSKYEDLFDLSITLWRLEKIRSLNTVVAELGINGLLLKGRNREEELSCVAMDLETAKQLYEFLKGVME